MYHRALTAAGIRDPRLRASYQACRRLNAQRGRTYYLATLLLPPAKRPYVHALYGFARTADDIVDAPGRDLSAAEAGLKDLAEQLRAGLRRGRSEHPVLGALVDTVGHWEIPIEYFEAFLESMAMDLAVTEYATYDDLLHYVHGSAAVIGLQMVRVLEPVDEAALADAEIAAQQLGIAFQLANFVRDVGEDLDRGRVYLPLEDLDRFGLTRPELDQRRVDDRMRSLLGFEIARVRRLEKDARPGIDLLTPSSRPAIDAARILYCGIVDEVESMHFQVFDRRATVPYRRRLGVAGRAWLSSRSG